MLAVVDVVLDWKAVLGAFEYVTVCNGMRSSLWTYIPRCDEA
jgi:hypothetical protein